MCPQKKNHKLFLTLVLLSHNNPCFRCDIAILNFLVLHTCEIRFHDVIGQSTVLRETTSSSMAASGFLIQYLTTALGRILFSSVVMVMAFQPVGPDSNPIRTLYFCHAFINFFFRYELCICTCIPSQNF